MAIAHATVHTIIRVRTSDAIVVQRSTRKFNQSCVNIPLSLNTSRIGVQPCWILIRFLPGKPPD